MVGKAEGDGDGPAPPSGYGPPVFEVEAAAAEPEPFQEAPESVPFTGEAVPGRPEPGQAWGETAFGEGEVRWAPELPPGWVAAGGGAEVREEPPGAVGVVGDGPPTYAAEPTAWPEADPDMLDAQVPDTVLDGAQYGPLTVRSAAVRGDSARYRGQPRRDALLTARFGTGNEALLLVAMASGARGSDDAHRAAQDAVRWIAGAVGRSRARLSDDLRAARRGSLKSGLHRLTDRCYGRLRARGEDLGLAAGAYTAAVRCLLLPADPDCRIRLFFGVGDGGLFRLRDGGWQDLDPLGGEPASPEPGPSRLVRPPGASGEPHAGPPRGAVPERGEPEGWSERPGGPEEYGGPGASFRFRATEARPGDVLLMCGAGMAEPLRGEPELPELLAGRWGTGQVPGLAAYLADVQTRVKGYADDRTAVTVWDA
ncbi:protein phosphatase 2C domain-containing protein [Actinacidiphila yeochonensis]|uniref:protein phosphatase 2C domain-containing protein n=1 Tax=Actinacidiphila yeochonensis TaxID=89050 RepID=UPI00099CE1E4|nr:protein phosphatase 2C domain-containing protein [Actinacidiphila yeochonensis]